MGNNFVRVQGTAKVYQKTGNGLLDPVADPADFAARNGGNGDINANTDVIGSLNDAYNPEATAAANAQIDPQLTATQQSLGAEKDAALTGNTRLLDSLKQLFADRANSDPYARSGIVSGAANANETQRETQSVTQAGQDLQAKLSDIAARLTNATSAAGAQKNSIIQQIKDSYATNAANANKVTAVDLGDRIEFQKPDGTVVRTVAKGAAPSSSGSSLSTAAGKNSALLEAVQNELATGDYSTTGEAGKQTREQLIGKLSGAFAGTGITNQMIKDAVYGNARNTTEGAYVPGNSSATAKDQQVQTNIGVAQQALKDLQDASNAINISDTRTSPGYAKQLSAVASGKIQGNSSPVTQLGLQGEAILTAVRALTNTGRVTQSEMNAIQLPTAYDTRTQAQAKITALQRLLQKAAGGSPSSGPTIGPPAPSGGGLNSIWGF